MTMSDKEQRQRFDALFDASNKRSSEPTPGPETYRQSWKRPSAPRDGKRAGKWISKAKEWTVIERGRHHITLRGPGVDLQLRPEAQ
jgi:hypothetical protein